LTWDVLHRDEVHALVLADVVDRDDVRMIQARRGSRFLDEALAAFGVEGGFAAQDLDRHGPAQSCIDGAVHGPHPAFTERLQELVMRERFGSHLSTSIVNAA
jgi:hypothetical protein